jgi:hypothetical protein
MILTGAARSRAAAAGAAADGPLEAASAMGVVPNAAAVTAAGPAIAWLI